LADEPYGVLTGRPLDLRVERQGASPHVQVFVDGGGVPFRAAINVRSSHARPGASDLLFLIDDDLRHPIAAAYRALSDGFLEIDRERDRLAIDYQRGGLFDRRQLRRLPAALDGPDNDLTDAIAGLIAESVADPAARLHVVGHRWGPEPGDPDDVFGFEPGNGVHNVHMNQGSLGRHARDNRPWNDGALFVDLQAEDRVAAVFLAFQSQSWRTDDHGQPLQTRGRGAEGKRRPGDRFPT
jgi:uncharacterized protein YukJ